MKSDHDKLIARNRIIGALIGVGFIIVLFVAIGGMTLGALLSETAKNPATATQNTMTSNAPEKTTPTPEPVPEVKKPAVPPEYISALAKGTTYATGMNMSKQRVYDQLVSPYGEKFAAEAAQYAIDNLKADWNANALAKAKNYQKTMNMSPARIHDQLTSEYGEKFTQAEADFAIAHLND
jgi:hypothetical protein